MTASATRYPPPRRTGQSEEYREINWERIAAE
jgi:hypothetical protein